MPTVLREARDQPPPLVGSKHAVFPLRPQLGIPLVITNGDEEAHCPRNTGRDREGRMTWC